MRVTVFFIIAFSIFFAIYWIVIGRLFSYFDIKRAWLLASILVACTFSAMFLQGQYNTQSTHLLQNAFMIIMGIIWVSTTVIILAEVARLLIPSIPKGTIGLFALGIIAILTIVSLILANTWQVQKYTITTNKVTQPVRIVQLSDLHIQGINGNKTYYEIIKKSLEQKPNMILITGDIIDPGLPKNLYYNTTTPIIATMGNHEFYVGENISENYFNKSGMITLREDSIEQSGITIIGVDDHASIDAVETAIINSKSKKPPKYSILMYHSPVAVEKITGVDLVLSGHTHAGQLFPFNFFIPLQFKYVYGWYDLPYTKLYVTSGAGTWGPPMRLGTANEIVVIDIVPKK